MGFACVCCPNNIDDISEINGNVAMLSLFRVSLQITDPVVSKISQI